MRKVVNFFVLILALLFFCLSSAMAQVTPTPNTCVGCPIVSPVPYILANCTPTPTATPTATPTKTATPPPTATPHVCVDSLYDPASGHCYNQGI